MSLPCIPDLNDFIENEFISRTMKCCTPVGNQIYAVGYAAGQGINLVTDGVPTQVGDGIAEWFFKLSIAFILPWVIMLIVLCIVLMNSGAISYNAGVWLIVITIIVATIAFVWALYETESSAESIYDQAVNKINANWDTNKNIITDRIINAYQLTAYDPDFPTIGAMCNPDEQNACCDPIWKSSCTTGCNDPSFIEAVKTEPTLDKEYDIELSLSHKYIKTNATGMITISVANGDIEDIEYGNIIIPAHLNVDEDADIIIPIPKVNKGEILETDYEYVTGDKANLVDIKIETNLVKEMSVQIGLVNKSNNNSNNNVPKVCGSCR